MSRITSISSTIQLPSPPPLLILIFTILKLLHMFLFIFTITLNRIGRQYYYLTFTDEEREIWTNVRQW